MDAWLEWARGPMFVFTLLFMVLGLIRHVGLTMWGILRTMKRAGDKSLPYRRLAVATLKWLFPLEKLRTQFLFSIVSIVFHIAILIVPIFLGGHIVLWARGIGVSWPSIPNDVADVLTLVAIVAAVALVVQRALATATRALSRAQDYLLPVLIALPFATGFMVMHPAWSPFSYSAVLLVHVLSANLVMILIPITKLSHALLMPSVQLVSEIGWRWPADAGTRVAMALGKEGEPP